jgi:drug/metabolite transporter (DMT)-like permease
MWKLPARTHKDITDPDVILGQTAWHHRLSGNVRGILIMILGVALFAVMDALVKHLTSGYSVPQVMFFRTLGALPVVMMLASRLPRAQLAIRGGIFFVLRCFFGIGAIYFFMRAVHNLPLAEVSAIGFAVPIIITGLSAVLLREKVGVHRWGAVIFGFIGILIILKPGGEVLSVGALWAIGAVMCFAFSMLAVRCLRGKMGVVAISFYFTVVGVVISGVALPFVWVPPSISDAGVLLAMGMIGGLAQLCLTTAMQTAPPSVVAPFEYMGLIFTTGIGYVFFDELPAVSVFYGAPLVVGAGLFIMYREGRGKK